MKISQNGINFIKKWEGCKLKPYKDAAGLWTIGIGHLIKDNEDFSQGITQEEADELLRKDVKWVENTIERYVTITLNQNQYDSICSLIFNIGQRAFYESTLLKWLNANRINDLPQQYCRWNKAGGKSLLGLARRRVAEAALFLS